MHPILFTIGGLSIYSYGVALALAFLIATLLAARYGKAIGVNPERIIDLSIVVVIASLVGARIAYLLSEPETFDGSLLSIINVRSGGLAFQGGLAAGILAGIAYCKISKTNPWKVAEVVPAPIALGYAIARLGGCFMNGCCYGLPTKSPIGIVFPSVDDFARHPTQVYSAIGGLLIFFIMIATRKHKMFEGFSMFLFVALYAAERFIVEFFRDRPLAFGSMSYAQIACIIAFIFSVFFIFVLQKRRGQTTAGRVAAGR